MDPIRNPFSPGAGAPPPELVGREEILRESEILFSRVFQGRPEKSFVLTGLRGVGKTVLLNELEKRAIDVQYHSIFIEAHEDKNLAEHLIPRLRSLAYRLESGNTLSEKTKRILAVLKSFVSAIKIKLGEVELGLDIDPEKGIADTGDIELDLADLFIVVGEAVQDKNKALILLIDELQYFSQKELSALIMAMHKMQQKQLPIILVAAGLPILPALSGDSKTYAERLFYFPEIGALSRAEVAKALQDPVVASGMSFTDEALDLIYDLTKGYPYFVQEWGYQCWNIATQLSITKGIVEEATGKVITRLDRSFFRVRLDRLTPKEQEYLRAMAEFGDGAVRVGDIAGIMNSKTTALTPLRDKLIKKGMIYSPEYGSIAFSVPLFDQFMKRVIPAFRK
ncbi:MAG: ATP-binding protein [Candidatus Paracaedibacteraceae bacterium]|nr:ATP-binding protein [Candidatus Paracaedibacteraceae bacterium]